MMQFPAAATRVITGHVMRAPPPKAIKSMLLRPMRSDNQPHRGCATRKAMSVAALSSVASALENPAVLVKNFCMYVVYT